ncbi:transcriptional regulator with XRE-family HTH domain [Desulfobaculum xiamenense]|uniref:Transcriptional regulator with XRE-family HTH domain n=1 Tax=Desulfobaculum xiamenense TaxID=995050 RepID=A0A846QH23_9BACT|nr:helix-turn-helix transcriptional regulator [Desulfobaculum xiamenense]NJB66420.1 transcriptional regulator with XRE-family HTH domain [Desulfobaculum xiamenense]
MINQTAPHGQDQQFRAFLLRRWLREHGYDGRALARRLHVSPSRVSQIILRGACPRRHIETLAAIGVPADLLPLPSPERPGPQKGWLERRLERARREDDHTSEA